VTHTGFLCVLTLHRMIHALEFFGGVPTLAVPDNTKTAVTRACRYDPDERWSKRVG